MCFTCHRDDKRRVHGVDAEGPGAGGQVEVGDEVGQLAKDQGPRVDAEERVLEQGEVQHFGLRHGRLARRAGVRGNSGNGGGTEVAIDLRQAVWSCGFALARVVVLGLVCIQTIEDLPGYFRVQQCLSGLLLFAPIVCVRSGGREGGEGAGLRDAVGQVGGAVGAALGVFLVRGALQGDGGALLGGGSGGVRLGLHVDGPQEHPGGHEVEHEAAEDQHRACRERKCNKKKKAPR